MGKATRWLKGLLGMKKEKDHCDNSSSLAPDKKEKKRWSFRKSGKGEVNHIAPTMDNDRLRSYVAEKENEQNKKAIVVAAATAADAAVAAAQAAVAAAQAAVSVLRLRRHDSGILFSGSRERWASVKIQSFFRGYLARKALRALKALVKIQALVRGYLVRKMVAETLRGMQALIRAQTAVRSQRARRSMSKESRLQPEIRARKYVQRCDETSDFHSKRLPRSYETSLNGFDDSPEIVEINTYRPQSRSIANCCVLHNAPATPVKSVGGDTFRPYSNSPNYMANTQSSKAKLRSHSAPKQRPEPKKRVSLDEIVAARNSISSGVRMNRSSHPQTKKYCIFNKVIQACCVNWESQKENLRGN